MPTELQKAMDLTLINLTNTLCILDHILIVLRGSLPEHNELVKKAVKRVEAEGFSLKLSKCEFSLHKVNWLGYEIDEDGYRPIH